MKQETRRDEGSFRDPAGRVFMDGDRALRAVSPAGWERFRTVWESGVLREPAVSKCLLPAERLASSEEAALVAAGVFGSFHACAVLCTRRLSFVSYPYEWGFEALRSAALLHLRLQLSLLSRGFTLSDASAFNVQFDGSCPVFIDTLSVIPYEEGEPWTGYGQFQRQFLNPLLFESHTGLGFGPWWRGSLDGMGSHELLRLLPWNTLMRPSILTHVVPTALFDRKGGAAEKQLAARRAPRLPKARFVTLLRHLEEVVSGLRRPAGRVSLWEDYTTNNSYADPERVQKLRVVGEFVGRCRPSRLLDIGSNTGEYAEHALRSGAGSVLGIENDRGALDGATLRAFQRRLSFTALAIDITNPSPAQGWRGRERGAFDARLETGALLALAVIHHIVIRNNIPLEEAVQYLVSLAPRGIIEFVPKEDLQVKRMLRHREDIFEDYHKETFLRALGSVAIIRADNPVTGSGRSLVEYERR